MKKNNYYLIAIILTIFSIIIFISQYTFKPLNTSLQTKISSSFKQLQVSSLDNQLTKEKTHSNPKIDQDSTIISCKPLDFLPDTLEASLNLWFDLKETMKKQLENANLKDETLISVDFFDFEDTKGKAKFIGKFLKKNPKNSLAYWMLLDICQWKKSNLSYCDDNMIKNAINSDPGNGAFWFQDASFQYQKGDLNSTNKALRKLLETQNFDIYYGKYLKENLTTMFSLGYENNRQTKFEAFAFASTVIGPRFSDVLDYCREHTTINTNIAQLCIDVGKNMVLNSKTYISSQIGYALQTAVYKLTKNKIALDQVEKEKNQSEYHLQKSLRSKAHFLLDYDDLLYNYYINSLFINGERIANKHLIEEAIRLSKNPNYNPCP